MKRKLLTILTLLFLLPVLSMSAHAQEDIPEVATLAELQAAIEAAEDGDTIRVTETIIIDEPMTVGDNFKTVVIEPVEITGTVFRISGGSESAYYWLNNMQISFSDTPSEYAIEINTASDCMIFLNGIKLNHCGGGVHITRGRLFVQLCEFTDCHAASGGAVSVDGDAWCQLSDSTLTDNSTDGFGGAVYSIGELNIDNCTFEGNEANDGGAIAGYRITISRATIKGNKAAQGGGVYAVTDLTATNSHIYDNTATVAGADIFCEGTTTITAEDYMTLFAEIISEREADSVAWYIDNAEGRYSAKEPTEVIEDTEGISGFAGVFAIYKAPEPEPDPEPEPEPDLTPEIITPIIIYRPVPTPTPTKPAEEEKKDDTPLLVCGVAQIDRENVEYMIDATKRFVPAQERLTRGRLAALIYGLLSEESQAECAKVAKDCFTDLAGSPYKSVVNALTGAEVFCGCSGAVFKPNGILTYGQLLSVLTRFVEPKEGYIGSFNPSEHWAATAAITAASYGWIEDVPIDLNAPATYGAFVNLLIKIYGI